MDAGVLLLAGSLAGVLAAVVIFRLLLGSSFRCTGKPKEGVSGCAKLRGSK